MNKISPTSKIKIKRQKSRKYIQLFGFVVFLIIIFITTITLSLTISKKEKNNLVVTKSNIKNVVDTEKEPVSAGYYEVQMNTTWNFKSGNKRSYNAVVSNSPTNSNTVYFTITVDGELIYTSPYLPVKSSLKNIKLEKKLEKNTYHAIMKYHLVDDNYSEVSTLSVSLTIVIEH